MARLYADENYDYRVVEELRKLGHDVLTASEAGQARQRISDAQVLAFAISQKRAVITFDRRHFIRLHQQVQTHSGIIVCTDDRDWIALAARVHQAMALCQALIINSSASTGRPNLKRRRPEAFRWAYPPNFCWRENTPRRRQ